MKNSLILLLGDAGRRGPYRQGASNPAGGVSDATCRPLFKEIPRKNRLPGEPLVPSARLTFSMKKILLLLTVLFGTVAASQAGIGFNFGISVPLPGVVYAPPAPVIVAPAPYYAAPPPYVVAPPVVVAPPSLYFGYGPRWYGHPGWGYRHGWRRHW